MNENENFSSFNDRKNNENDKILNSLMNQIQNAFNNHNIKNQNIDNFDNSNLNILQTKKSLLDSTDSDSDSKNKKAVQNKEEKYSHDSSTRIKSSSRRSRNKRDSTAKIYHSGLDESSSSDIEFQDDIHGDAQVKIENDFYDSPINKNKVKKTLAKFHSNKKPLPPLMDHKSLQNAGYETYSDADAEPLSLSDDDHDYYNENHSNSEVLEESYNKSDDLLDLKEESDRNQQQPQPENNNNNENINQQKLEINNEEEKTKNEINEVKESDSENKNESPSKGGDVNDIINSLRKLSRNSIRKEKPAFPLPTQQTLELEMQKPPKESEIPEKIGGGIILYRVQTPGHEDEDQNYGLHQVHPQISIPFPEEMSSISPDLSESQNPILPQQQVNDNYSLNETEKKDNDNSKQESNKILKIDDDLIDLDNYQSIMGLQGFPDLSLPPICSSTQNTDTSNQEDSTYTSPSSSLGSHQTAEPSYGLSINKSPRRTPKNLYQKNAEAIAQMLQQKPNDRESSMVQNMKQLALNNQPLPNVPDNFFQELINELANDKYELIQKRLFEEAAIVASALEFAQNERIRIKKENVFQEAQNQHRQNVEQLQKEIDQFNEESQILYNQLQMEQNAQRERMQRQHDAENDQLIQLWSSDQKLRLYNRASPMLVQSRNQLQVLIENSRFDEAKILQHTIHQLEEKEQQQSHANMQRDFDIAAENLKKKHEQEIAAFQSRIEAQNEQFVQKRKQARIHLERRQKRIEAEAEMISDPNKVWNRNQMQQKEENVALMLSRNSLPQTRPFTRGTKPRPKPSTIISLPPLNMSKGRKLNKSKLPPLQ